MISSRTKILILVVGILLKGTSESVVFAFAFTTKSRLTTGRGRGSPSKRIEKKHFSFLHTSPSHSPSSVLSKVSDTEDEQKETPTSESSITIPTPTPIYNEFDQILQSRRTINNFQPNLPDNWEEVLQNAIQSAIYAPNHKRTEPWRFHLLGPETIQKVCELNASIVAEKKGEKAGEKKLERWLQMPGWLVVTCRTTASVSESASATDSTSNSSMGDPMSIEREDYAACCCAVQNLCLSLHNQGFGTKWTTGPVNFDERFAEIVGLNIGESSDDGDSGDSDDSDDNDDDDCIKEFVVGTIWFGIPEKPATAPNKVHEVKDVLIFHT